jgi:hypothetical protein
MIDFLGIPESLLSILQSQRTAIALRDEKRSQKTCEALTFRPENSVAGAHFHSQLLQASELHLSVINGELCIIQAATAALGNFAAEREPSLNKNPPMQLWLCHKADEGDFEMNRSRIQLSTGMEPKY